jgi:K+ transporter
VIGNIFGPAMLVWFVAIGLLGLLGIMQTPGILAAISPHYAVAYLMHAGPGIAFAVLGKVFLALTGAEAMYADMGHLAAAIFTASSTGIPLALTHHLRHNRVLHERVLRIASISSEVLASCRGEGCAGCPRGCEDRERRKPRSLSQS